MIQKTRGVDREPGGHVNEIADARDSLGMASATIEDLAGGEAVEGSAAVARLSGGGADVALNVSAGIPGLGGAWTTRSVPADFEAHARARLIADLAARGRCRSTPG